MARLCRTKLTFYVLVKVDHPENGVKEVEKFNHFFIRLLGPKCRDLSQKKMVRTLVSVVCTLIILSDLI